MSAKTLKISELIARLEEVKEEHGDLPVYLRIESYGFIDKGNVVNVQEAYCEGSLFEIPKRVEISDC